jgi:hypothetical protein
MPVHQNGGSARNTGEANASFFFFSPFEDQEGSAQNRKNKTNTDR